MKNKKKTNKTTPRTLQARCFFVCTFETAFLVQLQRINDAITQAIVMPHERRGKVNLSAQVFFFSEPCLLSGSQDSISVGTMSPRASWAELLPLLLISAYCCLSVVFGEEEPIVTTSSGPVAGKVVTAGAKEVDAFYGIPYAKPPLGDLRFRKPLPAERWNKTYNAKVKTPACPQTDIRFLKNVTLDYASASEDCLYLNVWRPSGMCRGASPCKKNLPVLVFIYGGAFQWGDSGIFLYDAANFVALSEVIVVSFNHRLSLLGFITTGTSELPGNLGFWDQLLALKWVQKNIGSFGGNPGDVTIGGHSAGAISAGLHSISPLSKGLFRRIIMQSASPLTLIFGLSQKGSGRFLETAGKLGCYDASRDWKKEVLAIISCLRKMDVSTMFKKLKEQSFDKQMFNPSIGDEFISSDPLSAAAWENFHIKEILTGTTTNEGTLFVDNLKFISPQLEKLILQDYRFAGTIILNVLFQIPISAGKTIVQEYLGDYDVEHDEETATQLISEMVGDGIVNCPVQLFAELASSKGITTYRYKFDHRPSFSLWPKWFGVTHSDELPFTLGSLAFFGDESRYTTPFNSLARRQLSDVKYTTEEEQFMKEIVGIWTAFVRNG